MKWLLLTHQLPSEPSNIRVKIWRRLQNIGAVPIKNSIYVLPNRPGTREDFEWLRKEITGLKGDASVFVADSVSEMDDKEIAAAFRESREKEYRPFIEETESLAVKLRGLVERDHIDGDHLNRIQKEWAGLSMRWERLQKIDFFDTPSHGQAEKNVRRVRKLFEGMVALSEKDRPAPPESVSVKSLSGKTWVTRTSPHIDRLACAWFIRRFIDKNATFKFVKEPYQATNKKELRFDMREGEFTHFGDWCSFETFLHRLGLRDPALDAVSEIIHDIDLKDKKFSRLEAPGVEVALRGLCRLYPRDQDRVKAGCDFFEALYHAFTEPK